MANDKTPKSPLPIKTVDDQPTKKQNLSKLEKVLRQEKRQSIRVAAYGGNMGNSGGSSVAGADSNFYSPQLSTDFLELPQSEREKRELFRFWYNCFIPGTPVTLSDGTRKYIQDVQVGDLLPNGFGKPTRVVSRFENVICDEIIGIKVNSIQDEIKATGNHPFLTFRGDDLKCEHVPEIGSCESGNDFIHHLAECSDKGFGSPKFTFAKDLRVGDYLVSPSMRDLKETGLNRDQLRFLGYFAAWGLLKFRENDLPCEINFSLNINKIDTIAVEIAETFHRITGEEAIVYTSPTRNTCEVVCDSKEIIDLCRLHVVTESHDKKLSEVLVKAIPEEALDFLGAFWNVGGCLTDNSCAFYSTSTGVSHQVHQMLRNAGIPATCAHHERPARVHGDINYPAGVVNFVSFPGHYYDHFKQYANFLSGSYSSTSTGIYTIKSEFGFLHRIDSLEVIYYEGPICNIEVDGDGDDKSYIAHGLSTHNTHPIVGSAIDFHTDVPMSKIRLAMPKGSDTKRNKEILVFYEEMCRRLHLFQSLYDATHEYWLQGNCYIFAEDHDLSDDIPTSLIADITEEDVEEVDYVGRATNSKKKTIHLKDESERINSIKDFVAKNYKGWQRLQILPPEQIKMEVFQYTNRTRMELIPSEKDRVVLLRAIEQGDQEAAKIANDIPESIREHLLDGRPIPLNTTPYDDFLCSSFCYHLAHKKSAYDDRGISLLERCHLPGTEVTIKRNGEILQECIEDLDPETDLVLSGRQEWRSFDHGTRNVSESIREIIVEKIYNKIRLTSDHKLQVLRNDKLVDVEAKDVFPGDYILIAGIPSKRTLNSVDFKEFVDSIEDVEYKGRKSGNVTSMPIEVKEYSDLNILVSYKKNETDPKKLGYYENLGKLLAWVNSLTEPNTVSGPGLYESFGLPSSNKTSIRKHLAELGVSTKIERVGRKYLTVFYPTLEEVKVDISNDYDKSFMRFLSLDADLGYLIGYWLGDGWLKKNGSSSYYGQLGICYSTKSENSVKSANLIKQILDKLSIKWTDALYGNCGMSKFDIFNDVFIRWIGYNFGHTSDDKKLPGWVYDTNEEFQFGILRGLIDSDGSIHTKKSGMVTVAINSTTKRLVDGLFLLMSSLGLPVSTGYTKSRDVRMPNGSITKNCKPIYKLSLSHVDSIKKIYESGYISKKIELPVIRRQGLGLKHKTYDGNTYYRIKEITSYDYDGPVYSLNVDEDHSFFANFVRQTNCLRTLLYADKLRQAQTSIASRAMTPKRVVWAENASAEDVEALRDQVDQALVDPDYSIIANFEVHWDEVGARDRLLDLTSEYDNTNKLLYIGLRVTESMLTGESSYSGERIHLDVMNTMYLLYRERISEFVEEYLFAPVAEKKGYYDIDEFGNKTLLYPKLQFTRLALRDNSELQDFMFNLYQKGSLPVSYMLELLNIDPNDAFNQLKKDLFTPYDSTFNEFVRNVSTNAASIALEKTDVFEKIIGSVGLKMTAPKDDRFGG